MLQEVVSILGPDKLLMGEHVILDSRDHTFRIHGAANAEIRLEPRKVNIARKHSNQFIKKGLPLIKEQG